MEEFLVEEAEIGHHTLLWTRKNDNQV